MSHRRRDVHHTPPCAILRRVWHTCSMNSTLSAKLQVHTTPDQFRALRRRQLAYRAALNDVSRSACEHGKLSNTVAVQESTYRERESRTRFGLPAQLACAVPRQVGARWAPGGR